MDKLSRIHFQNEGLIRKSSLQCSLFLHVEEDICRVLILDAEKKVQLIEEISVKKFLDGHWTFANLKFAETFLMVTPETFIFIPEEIENQEETNDYTPFLNPESSILLKKINNTKINTHFTMGEQALHFQNLLNVSQTIPSSNILIQYLLTLDSLNKESIGINFQQEHFELAYVKNNQFIFYNRFPKENADDFNYFLLSVIEQFEIKISQTHFYLSGDINAQDESYRRLEKYSSHIQFLSDLKEFEKLDLKSDSLHQFLLLSELSKCV